MERVREVREVRDVALDIRLTRRSPAEFNAWFEENLLQRTLAHLLGYTGSGPVLLRATSSGVLRIVLSTQAGIDLGTGVTNVLYTRPTDAAGNQETSIGFVARVVGEYVQVYGPTQVNEAALIAGLTTVDFAAEQDLVQAISPDVGPVRCYSSLAAGGFTVPLGIVAAGHQLVARSTHRYLDLVSPGVGFAHVRTFAP